MATNNDVSIPGSAASRNLRFSLLFLAIGLVLFMCHSPTWLLVPVFGLAGGFLLMMITCILDIQEFKMKQNQKIIQLLAKIANTNNNN